MSEVTADVAQGRALWVEMRSPDGPIWSGQVRSITLPSVKGTMGVLPRHAPLMAALEVGRTKVVGGQPASDKDPSGDVQWVTGDGFVEIFENRVLVLVDFADNTEDIDVERARESRDRARARILTYEEGVDRARAEMSLRRAMLRLQHSGRPRI